jgi:hypothetical protein
MLIVVIAQRMTLEKEGVNNKNGQGNADIYRGLVYHVLERDCPDRSNER